MKFVVLLLLAQLSISCASLSNDAEVLNLANMSDNSIKGLFKKYSQNESYMRFSDFESFLEKVIHTFKHKNEHSHSHDDHSHSHENNDNHSHENSTKTYDRKFDHKCFESKLLNLKEVSNNNHELIEKGKFAQLSSILVIDMDQCIKETVVWIDNNKDLFFGTAINFKRENWIFAFLSAFIITVIGLLCYLVVPSLNAMCFNYLFQFLVALAVGTLTGDALLHLIPHAFSEHDHGSEGEGEHSNDGVYKGMGAVVGIYVFFIIERSMQIRRARKEKRHRHEEHHEEQLSLENHRLNDDHNHNHSHNSNQISSNETDAEKSNAVVYCTPVNSNNKVYSNELGSTSKRASDLIVRVEEPDCLVIHANKDLKYISKYLPNNKCAENVDHHDHEAETNHLHQHGKQSCLKNSTTEGDEAIREHKHSEHASTSRLDDVLSRHSHSHGHSHKHKYKSSREKAHHDHHRKHEKEINDIKLIAWMVLMGDGLHNFSDGLAIGASFAQSVPIGFGTSIAVLCHELPHEIGDFAVLRRAGVSLQRALVFNVISGVLCMFGTFVGLMIGSFAFLSNWVFLFIAGTFLYISLVDMIPELSEDKDDDSILNFFIQSVGILVGIGIMLFIALFEDTFIQMFNK